MHRLRFLLVLAVFVIVLALQTIPAHALYPIGNWLPVYNGVEYNSGTATSPRLMRAFATRIDLKNPSVWVYASHDNGGNPYDTLRQTPLDFVNEHGLKCAVNTCFFDLGLSPNTNIFGLLISNGVVASPASTTMESQLCFDIYKNASIASRNYTPTGMYNAVGTGDQIVSGGINIGPGSDLQPRTACGLSSDNRYLYMVVVDGRQSGWSDGASWWDMGEWMLSFGAYNASQFDGGGSTCLAISGWWGGGIVNRPCDGSPRAVGANLGIGAANIQNPPFLFDGGSDTWFVGNGGSPMQWTNCCGWPGIDYTDQIADDCWINSGTTNFTGLYGPECYNVNVYPQYGSTQNHDIQAHWRTVADNIWSAAKSSPVVNYSAQNAWACVNLDVNNDKWWNQTIVGMRVDFDAINHGNRWLVNHIVKQSQFWWHYSSDIMGWTPGNSLSALWQTTCCGWSMGILYCDQTGNNAYMLSPAINPGPEWPYRYIGGSNDKIQVIVYPQNGNTTSHDMAIYWTHESDGTWNEAKSTHVSYTGQNQWVTVTLPVGTNTNWAAKHITQIRVDFDETNHGNRWLVDSVRTTY